MRSILTIILPILAMIGLILVIATIGGFMLWWIWPIVIPSVFPGLVASGVIASEIELLPAILLHWMIIILFHSSSVKAKKG